MSIMTTIIVVIILLAGNAFFVASEFSLISSRRDRIEALIAQGRNGATKVLYATEHLSIMLAGAQFGITVCSLILGKVAEPAIAHFIEVPFEHFGLPADLLHPISFVIALALITFLHILFGEMVPKNIAIAGPETLALWLAPAIIGWVKITRPIISFLNWIARITLHAFGIEQRDELDSRVDQNQLATMIAESRAEGYLDAEEHARLTNALKSEGRLLSEVMVPLDRVSTLSFESTGPTLGQLEQLVTTTGYSRYPVIDRNDSYLGYIHVKDVLAWLSTAEKTDIIHREHIRPLLIVDGEHSLEEALHLLHSRSAHMAQVRIRGELVGIITLEDIIKEYVGSVGEWTAQG